MFYDKTAEWKIQGVKIPIRTNVAKRMIVNHSYKKFFTSYKRRKRTRE